MHAATTPTSSSVLAQERSLTDAAEAHGTLAGVLCAARPAIASRTGCRRSCPRGGRPGPRRATCASSSMRPRRRSIRPDMEFEPLLPDDEAPLEERTAALAQWCQGFLYGLGSGSITGCERAARRGRRGGARLHRDHPRRGRCGRRARSPTRAPTPSSSSSCASACSSCSKSSQACAPPGRTRRDAAALKVRTRSLRDHGDEMSSRAAAAS